MKTDSNLKCRSDPRRQGSVYILVLGASLIVAAIGISSLMAARVQMRATQASSDMTQALQLARSAIDLGLCTIRDNPTTWRAMFAAGTVPTNLALGSGTLTLTTVDPVDGDLNNNNTDPVVLTGTGTIGDARYMLEVTLNSDGSVAPGTWKRVVN